VFPLSETLSSFPIDAFLIQDLPVAAGSLSDLLELESGGLAYQITLSSLQSLLAELPAYSADPSAAGYVVARDGSGDLVWQGSIHSVSGDTGTGTPTESTTPGSLHFNRDGLWEVSWTGAAFAWAQVCGPVWDTTISVPVASPTVSGTVKVDQIDADPVVYLASSVDALLNGKEDSLPAYSDSLRSNGQVLAQDGGALVWIDSITSLVVQPGESSEPTSTPASGVVGITMGGYYNSTWNSGLGQWEWNLIGSVIVPTRSIASLSDVPSYGVPEAGYALRVDVPGSGLEWVPDPVQVVSWGDIQGSISNQTDLTPSAIGAANTVLENLTNVSTARVNLGLGALAQLSTILDAHVDSSADIAWSKISKAGSVPGDVGAFANPMSAKGQVLVQGDSGPLALPAGSFNNVLAADSSTTWGLAWRNRELLDFSSQITFTSPFSNFNTSTKAFKDSLTRLVILQFAFTSTSNPGFGATIFTVPSPLTVAYGVEFSGVAIEKTTFTPRFTRVFASTATTFGYHDLSGGAGAIEYCIGLLVYKAANGDT
jgi:hypothetical protein